MTSVVGGRWWLRRGARGEKRETARPVGPGGPFCCECSGMVRVQLGRRWAKIAISSRIDWVGAECQARSMARFWRLISRRWRMRSIMLMVVLTSPAFMASSSVLTSWRCPKYAAP